MALTVFDPNTTIEYIPACGKNRDSEDPCVVKLKYVPFSKVQAYERLLVAKTRGDRSKVNEVLPEIQKKQFLDSVESISGFFIGTREVTDPEEFYEAGDTAIIVELLRAMESLLLLKEGLLKN
ncbi:MAG: hypothetical protein ACE5GY_10355 [Thermodesulfobacteriota bacterium]